MNKQLTPQQMNYLVSMLKSSGSQQDSSFPMGMPMQDPYVQNTQMASLFGQGRPTPAPGTETTTVGMRG